MFSGTLAPGLLHPFDDYEARTPWLNAVIDPLDADGSVPLPTLPGLGHDINFDFIQANLV